MKTLFTLFFLIPTSFFAQTDSVFVLHYTETTGYNHGTKDESETMFEAFMDSMTAETGKAWILVSDDNGEEFDDLNKYSVAIFSNTSGNSGLSSQQRSNFEAWILNGGNVIGIHAASDTYRHSTANGNKTGDWDFWPELIGASVQENPNHTSSNKVADIHIWNTIYASGMPWIWTKKEEYYYWENGYLDTSFIEIMQVQSTGGNSYDAPRMVAHYTDLPGGGRSFYTSMGHSRDNFRDFDDATEEFYYFGVLLLNALKQTVVSTPFGIVFPDPEPAPMLSESGDHFDLEAEQGTYQVYAIDGRLVLESSFGPEGVPVYSEHGIWIYKTFERRWKHGVR